MDSVFKYTLIGVMFSGLLEIYFGLDKNILQICVISFCLGYYFGTKKTASVLRWNKWLFILTKRMDTLTSQFAGLDIMENCLLGKYLSA